MALRAQEAPAESGTALTASQKQALQKLSKGVEADAQAQAEQATLKLASIAKEIDRNLLADTTDQELDRKLAAELIGGLTDLVRAALEVKLRAVRDMVKLLTPAQRKFLMGELQKPGANPDLMELIPKVFGDLQK